MRPIMINYNDISKKKNLQLRYMDTKSFVLSVNTKDIIKDLKNLEDILVSAI